MTSGATTGILLAAGLFALAPAVAAQKAPASGPTHLSPDVLAMACSPALAHEPPPMPLRITGGQDSFARRVYTTSDLVTINAGTRNGIEVGQEFFVRRPLVQRRTAITPKNPATIRTAGWIKVYAVDDELSLATVTHACDVIEVGDYLEPLVLKAMPAASSDRGKPKRDDYGRVLTGTDMRRTFGTGDFFALNRGVDFGIVPGAQFVVYRDTKTPGNFLYEVGEAVAVSVNATWSTLRVTLARDAIVENDYVGMRTK